MSHATHATHAPLPPPAPPPPPVLGPPPPQYNPASAVNQAVFAAAAAQHIFGESPGPGRESLGAAQESC